MNVLTLIATAMSFFLALVCSWVLIQPFFSLPVESPEPAAREALRELGLRKEMALQALEDLEADFRSKKVESAEYETAKAELSVQAGGVLEQIEAVESSTTKAKSS